MAMSLKQLETMVIKLKAQVAEGVYAKNYLDIWQLMSTYSHLYYVGKNSEVTTLFAQKTTGVTMEIEDSVKLTIAGSTST